MIDSLSSIVNEQDILRIDRLIAFITVFGSILFGFALSSFKEWVLNRKRERDELFGVMNAIHAQFFRNLERLVEAKNFFESEVGKPGVVGFSPRLILVAVEGNINPLALRLRDDELLHEIIHTYEEHKHINRRWDFIDHLIKSGEPYHVETEVEATNVVLNLTEGVLNRIEIMFITSKK